jgi:hypothetical protein
MRSAQYLLLSAVLAISPSTFAQQDQPAAAPAVARVSQGPTLQYVDDEFAVITWSTDQPAESRVFYGKDAKNLSQVAEGGKAFSMRHQVDLRNLQPNTTYFFRIDMPGADAQAGNAGDLRGFQTIAAGAAPLRNQQPFNPSAPAIANNAPDASAAQSPDFGKVTVVKGPTIQYLDDSSAVIFWTTNVPASNTIYYGPDRRNLLYTAGNFQSATDHRVHISNLKPSTTYYFQLDEGSSRIGSFQTVVVGGQPQYDQAVSLAAGEPSSDNSGPQLTHREHVAAKSGEVGAGTEIAASLEQELSTHDSQPGQTFTAAITQPVSDADGQVVIPSGARLNGKVTEAEQGKNLPSIRGRGKLNLRFESITLPSGQRLPIVATLLSVHQSGGNGSVNSEGEVQSQTKGSTAAKGVGAGAGIGTIAGLIMGGPLKGLAIGAIAGGGYILASKGKDVELPENTGLRIRLDENLAVK